MTNLRIIYEWVVDMIFLLAPTSTPARIQQVGKISKGFIYYISLTGTTGTKESLSAGLDIGELRILREYQRESRSNNIKYIFAINSLYDIFKQSSNRSKLIKSLGMFTLNRSSYAKNILMSMALGNRRDAKFNFF